MESPLHKCWFAIRDDKKIKIGLILNIEFILCVQVFLRKLDNTINVQELITKCWYCLQFFLIAFSRVGI